MPPRCEYHDSKISTMNQLKTSCLLLVATPTYAPAIHDTIPQIPNKPTKHSKT